MGRIFKNKPKKKKENNEMKNKQQTKNKQKKKTKKKPKQNKNTPVLTPNDAPMDSSSRPTKKGLSGSGMEMLRSSLMAEMPVMRMKVPMI